MPKAVPKDAYFVLGDNRGNSNDSTGLGARCPPRTSSARPGQASGPSAACMCFGRRLGGDAARSPGARPLPSVRAERGA